MALGIAPSLRPGLASTGAGKPGKPSQEPTDSSWCPIHNVKMKRREKDGQTWYSHKTKDGWCRGQAEGTGARK